MVKMEFGRVFLIFLSLLIIQQTASKAIHSDAFRPKTRFISDSNKRTEERANDVITSLFRRESNADNLKTEDERELPEVDINDDDKAALLEVFRRVIQNLCLNGDYDTRELCRKRRLEKKGWGNPDSMPWMSRRIDQKFPF